MLSGHAERRGRQLQRRPPLLFSTEFQQSGGNGTTMDASLSYDF